MKTRVNLNDEIQLVLQVNVTIVKRATCQNIFKKNLHTLFHYAL